MVWSESLFRSNLGCNWLTCFPATLHLIKPSVLSIWFSPPLHCIAIAFQTATARKNGSFYSVTSFSFQVNVSALYIYIYIYLYLKTLDGVALCLLHLLVYDLCPTIQPETFLPATWFYFIPFGLSYIYLCLFTFSFTRLLLMF